MNVCTTLQTASASRVVASFRTVLSNERARLLSYEGATIVDVRRPCARTFHSANSLPLPVGEMTRKTLEYYI